MNTPVNDEMGTAFHEAGHAVIAYRFNHECDYLTIVPSDGIAGSFFSEGEWMDGSTDREQIMVLFAGFETQRLYDENANPLGSEADFEYAQYLLQYQPPNSDIDLKNETSKMVKDNWVVISAVATSLFECKTLSYYEWSIIIDAVDEGEDWRNILETFQRIFKVR
jgi:hypothetical protein